MNTTQKQTKAPKKAAKRTPNAAKKEVAKPAAPEAKRASKKDTVMTLLRGADGASAQEIMEATGWQRHYADVRIMPTCVGNLACGAGIAAMESA
jgi:hypothetical protein